MMWTEDIYLIGSEETESDAYGNPIVSTSKKLVQATEKQLNRYEFYTAAQAGIRPSKMFVIHSFEYDGEQKIEADGTIYSVIRTYQINDDELEVYVERKVGEASGR